MIKYREEYDSMGKVLVPENAYFGAQTQRALENFSISGLRFPRPFIRALGLIKKHSAAVNRDLGLLNGGIAEEILKASQEVVDGKLDAHFLVDVFQTGSGTSVNMNANEVIAGRANELLVGKRGGKSPVHPNDHVNLGQSSNDVIPSAIHVAALLEIKEHLYPSLVALHEALEEKSMSFASIKKIGRTHLQDAVPITLGQEFGGYSRQIGIGVDRMKGVEERLSELALGGTAVGTGLNTHPQFAARVVAGLSRETDCPFEEAKNHFAAQAAQDALVDASGALRTLGVSLIKIANDIRWLSSGPRCGLGELNIPPLQPGSSMMPGKVNPVIPEVVVQVAGQVIGNDAAIAFGAQAGNFELNVTLPLMAYNLLQSIDLLSSATRAFAEKCIRGISANAEKCAALLEQSLALATAFVPPLGYDRAASLAKKAYEQKKTIREVALEENVLPEQEIHRILNSIIYDPIP